MSWALTTWKARRSATDDTLTILRTPGRHLSGGSTSRRSASRSVALDGRCRYLESAYQQQTGQVLNLDRMPPPELDLIRQRYAYACGYCGVNEVSAGGVLTIDHYRPLSAGGTIA